MATLTVRNLEDDVVLRLRIRAAENRRSAEAEHREILRQALADAAPSRDAILARLKEFRERTSTPGGPTTLDDLHAVRNARMDQLCPPRKA